MLRKFHKLARWVITADFFYEAIACAARVAVGLVVVALLVAQRRYGQVPHAVVEPVLYLLVLALGVWDFFDARKAARTIRAARLKRRAELRKNEGES